MAEAARNERPDNQRVDLVTKFNERYAESLIDARVSETHTATEGWQHLYGNHVSTIRERRRSLAKRLRSMADTIELHTPSEDDDKAINEFKKEATAIRESDLSFEVQAIMPVKQPVLDCEQIINEFRNSARRDEAEAPMLNVGLEHLMRDAIAATVKVTWDDESGRVMVAESA